MTAPRAAILGCEGPALNARERAFFRDSDPWGFILFARNVETPETVRRLTGELREAVGRDAPILIDQEGGRVARLTAPHWREWAWMPELRRRFSGAALDEALRLRFSVIAAELRDVGVDVNCMPIADVAQADADPIISMRALGVSAVEVAHRARIIADATLAGGVLPVVKHLPGHGRATLDSHEALPVVDASLDDLRNVDFAAFRPLADLPMAMTAHVVFTALDADAPATTSPAGIRAIRDEIGFGGLLMTDDLSMKALSGDMRARCRAAVAAGCDMLLHCNGDMTEMAAVMGEAAELAGEALARADSALAARRPPEALDLAEADARIAEMGGA